MSNPANSVRVPACPCPACGSVCSGASAASTDAQLTPKPGDLSMCIYCGAMLAFTGTLKLRRLTSRQVRALPAATRAELAQIHADRKTLARQFPPPDKVRQ